MNTHPSHQDKQIGVINSLEQQANSNTLSFSTVSPVDDYENDTRICLTSVHIPNEELKNRIQDFLIEPLRKISPNYFYYPVGSLHMTIKNIRVINDPPHFTDEEKVKAKQVFELVIPEHKKFNVYFYRLLLFPNNLALIGTTDPELDNIILDLDRGLNEGDVPDDKNYSNSRYFFSNMTLARFNTAPTDKFLRQAKELSQAVSFGPYIVDSVTLLTCNAVFMKKNIIKTWALK